MPNDNPNPAALPNGSSTDRFVEQNLRTGTESLLTIPLIGWTPRGRAYGCGFSVARYGAQQSTDPWQPDCGNGIRPNGSEITGNDPTDSSDAIGPSFVQGWMLHLISRYGGAAAGGVRFYNLDNEPMLWSHTHRDVHPQPLGYDELRDRTIEYAAALKAVDPAAQTLGPAEWGWTNYFYSALDAAPGGAWWNNPLDRLAHGNLPLVVWYLQQLRAHEQQHGVRLLDYLDLHYYPQASGVSLSAAGGAATQALRLRSTRSLWDPTYTDESWIGEPVMLLPRMRAWVDSYYPGTKLAIGEYNWGAPEHIDGALAQADVLGIFGREGLDLATLWAPPAPGQPAAFAFRMYRNYDGAGGAFGDTAIAATSTDAAQLAAFAAERTSDGALTVLVINKTGLPLSSAVGLNGFAAAPTARVYRYSAANPAAIVRLADQAVSSGGFSAAFPANSLTLFVLTRSGVGPTATPTATPPPPATATRTFSASPTRSQTATATRTASSTPTPVSAWSVAGAVRYFRGDHRVAGVVVSAQGATTAGTTTDANGAYAFAALPAGSWHIAPRRSGGSGAGLSALDAAYVLQRVAGTRDLDAEQMLAADVTGDGTVSALDATRILQRVVGMLAQFPAAQRCASDWLFVPAAAPAPNQTPLAPAAAAAVCEPGALSFSPLAAAATAQNFRAILIGDVTGSWFP